MINIRTDLAIEATQICEKDNKGNIPGVEVDEHKEGEVKVTSVKIIDEAGEKAMGKPKGTYITIDIPPFTHYDAASMDEVSKVLALH